MSEMADGAQNWLITKKEPVLTDRVWGHPGHNDEGERWSSSKYKEAADKAVPIYIRDLTLWIMFNGDKNPQPNGSYKAQILRMNEFWNSVFKK